MFRFSPPGNIDDLENRPKREAFLRDWHDWIERQIRHEISNLKHPPLQKDKRKDYPVLDPLFFCEVDAASSDTAPVPWNAFPLRVTREYGKDIVAGLKWVDTLETTTDFSPPGAAAVTTKYRRQDEYCEWHWYEKNASLGERLVFTAEGPEYWINLAAHDFDHVVELYQKFVSPEVKQDELCLLQDIQFGESVLSAGTYNPFNIWNTEKGVMHLTHPANTLGAEINLAARATVLRRDAKGSRIVESRRLIASSGYGSVNRSSDPNIGFGVNITAVPNGSTKPLSITLANPIGLYMDSVAANRITDKDDQPLVGWFSFVRGVQGRGLMAVLQPPKGDVRSLTDVYVGGKKLISGGQVAAEIQMVIYAAIAQLNAPMSPLHPPFYRACVPKGTDVSDLSNVNLLPGFSAEQSCKLQGTLLADPLDIDEAYPDLYPSTVSPLLSNVIRRSMTRNG